MMSSVRLAIAITCLITFPVTAALADSPEEAIGPETNTIVVITPPTPVVVSSTSTQPPGALELPTAIVPTRAPQNEAWSNVSHINGTVVPVGERGNYLYSWKKTNIASNPLGWMFGMYGLSISHAVHPHAAIRIDGNLFRELDGNQQGYEFGASVPLYFKRVYQGPFVEPGVIVRDLDTTDMRGGLVGPEVLFGWHWTFDSGMNVAAAFGVARNLTKALDDGFESSNRVEPAGYFRIGYAY